MNCKEISQKLTEAKEIATEIKQASPDQLDQRLEHYLGIKNKFEEIIFDAERAEPNQYRIRERIAKKFDFDYVECLSGGVYMGAREDDKENEDQFLVNEQGNKVLTGPLHFRGDPGMGKFLVFESYRPKTDPYGRFLFINKDGKVIHDLGEEGGKERQIHFPDGGFRYSKMPTLIHRFDSSGNTGGQSFLRPDGKIILERDFNEETSTFSSDGYVWIKSPLGIYGLYDTEGKEVTSTASFDHIDEMINGISIAVKKTSALHKVYTIDKDGRQTDLNLEIDEYPLPIRHGDICTATKDKKPFYFTVDGKVLDIGATQYSGYVNEKEKVFKVTKHDGYDLVDLDGKNIFNETFSTAAEFREGLIEVTRKDGSTGYMDIDGNFIKPDTKAEVLSTLGFKNGRAGVKDEDGYFLIDKLGKDLFSGKRFEGIGVSDRQGVYEVTDFDETKYYIKPNGERIF